MVSQVGPKGPVLLSNFPSSSDAQEWWLQGTLSKCVLSLLAAGAIRGQTGSYEGQGGGNATLSPGARAPSSPN